MTEDYALSVVMPVYAGVSPTQFEEALESVYCQTYPPSEVIVVEDGPLSPEHYVVLERFRGRVPSPRRIVLPVNSGAGPANHAGLMAATSPWVAKMDADDICLPERFLVQVTALRADNLDLVGSAMLEFVDNRDNVIGVRVMPELQAEIRKRVRINNPVNHPTSIYRRAMAVAVGGYQPLPYLEDYDFVARLVTAGAKMRNLPDPLLLFRSGRRTVDRRRAAAALIAEITLQRNLFRYGLIGPIRLLSNLLVRCGFRLLPGAWAWRVYRRAFLARHDQQSLRNCPKPGEGR